MAQDPMTELLSLIILINASNATIKAHNKQITANIIKISETLLKMVEQDRARIQICIINDVLVLEEKNNTIPGIN